MPRSTYYAGISFDIFGGFNAAIERSGRTDIKVVTENIGFGTDKQLCYKAAEQLLMHANASVVFAYISHRTAQLLRPLFTAANRLLIVLDSGANVPQEWPESPNILYHSLHNSLGAWLMAKKAARDGFTQSGTATGYYDGGYLQTYAAYSAFAAAGGNTVFNIATGYTREDFSMQPLAEALQQHPESCTFGIFSADYVQWFFEEITARIGAGKHTFYLPPFALEETMLDEAVHPDNDLKGIACWARSLDNEANRTFVGAIEESGRTPNLFSLIGWEAGLLTNLVANAMDEHRNNGRTAGKALHGQAFETPRGTVRFHETNGFSLAPMYDAHVEKNASGNCTLVIDGTISADETAAAFEELVLQPVENAVSGWHNSYTCI